MPERCILCDKVIDDGCKCDPCQRELATAQAKVGMLEDAIRGWKGFTADLESQLAERDKGMRWIRQKLKLPDGVGMDDVYGEMHVMESHAHGYMTYIEAGKCDDKSGEIARLTVQLAERDAEIKSIALALYPTDEAFQQPPVSALIEEIATLRADKERLDYIEESSKTVDFWIDVHGQAGQEQWAVQAESGVTKRYVTLRQAIDAARDEGESH